MMLLIDSILALVVFSDKYARAIELQRYSSDLGLFFLLLKKLFFLNIVWQHLGVSADLIL